LPQRRKEESIKNKDEEGKNKKCPLTFFLFLLHALFRLRTKYATINRQAIAKTASKHGCDGVCVGVTIGVGVGAMVGDGLGDGASVGVDVGAIVGVGSGVVDGVGITTGPFISIGFPSTILPLSAMDHSQYFPITSPFSSKLRSPEAP
jgi:hypothetical protein